MTGDRIVYPALYGRLDLGFARVNGAGFGNCLFTYCHAVVIAQQAGARVVTPAWRTIPLNPKLRGRPYGGLMTGYPGEISGVAKALVLARHARSAPILTATAADAPRLAPGLTIVAPPYVFAGLHAHRDMLRERIVGAMRRPSAVPAWGAEDYVAMHVRLGDFGEASEEHLDSGGVDNLRIPIGWYVEVARRLRAALPDLPIRVFSNGTPDDLAPLLDVQGVALSRNGTDIADLFEMAGARLFVGSHSTFSQWAAFLGNMPTLWRDRARRPEQPTDADRPLFHVDRQLGGFPDGDGLDRVR